MSKPAHILITKTLSPEEKKHLQDAGLELTETDFIQTQSVPFAATLMHNNLILSSKNAVESMLQHPEAAKWKSKRIFCVGTQTKKLLESNGYTVEAYTGYAADLAEIICLVYPEESFTFLAGNLRRDTLPEMLTAGQIAFNEILVYETVLTPKKSNTSVDAILFFSPSAVASFFEKNSISKQVCFAIGHTTAKALENQKVKNILVAPKPTIESVLETVIQDFN